MKKNLFITLILALIVVTMPSVKAVEYNTYDIMYRDLVPLNLASFTDASYWSDLYIYNDFASFYEVEKNKEIFDTLYLNMMNYYNNNYFDDFPFYTMEVIIFSTSGDEFKLNSIMLNLHIMKDTNYYDYINDTSDDYADTIYSSYILGTYHSPYNLSSSQGYHTNYKGTFLHISFIPFYWQSDWTAYLPTLSFERNFDFTYQGSTSVFNAYDENNELIVSMEAGDDVPYVRQAGFDLTNYTTVNLDNYEYVLLNLKDYTNKDAFSTIIQVKGSIGITPIYEYGTVEKSTITDICNISYSDYTNSRLYVLENDLINNAIYAVKSCEDGSAFKFDNTIFDITYVTADNVDDPVITVGSVDYHTIPFNQLSNTVNKNTEEGLIPGESEEFNPIESVVDYVTSFWNSLSSFMSLVTKFFNTLPIEIRAVAITCFTTACTLGLIKILKS